jgi:GNAT superfamily N-acetyltransferase
MGNEIVIRQLALAERDKLLTFIEESKTFSPRQGDAEFWDWHFPQAPHTDADNLPVWVALDQEKIVGQLAATEVKLKVDAEVRDAIWILDLVVDPGYRRRGIAKGLAAAAEAFCPTVLGINTAAQHSTELLTSLGWKIVWQIPRFHKLLLPGSFVFAGGPVARLPARILDAALAPRARPVKSGGAEVRAIDSFGAEFDDLWARAKNQWRCSVVRDRAMHNWQYRDQPGKIFETFGVFREKRLDGYALLFRRRPGRDGTVQKAAITDILYAPDRAAETVDHLIAAMLERCASGKIASIVTDVVDGLISERLRHHGFWRVRKNPLQFLVKTREDAEVLCDPGNWFLTRGDADTSILEEVNLPAR